MAHAMVTIRPGRTRRTESPLRDGGTARAGFEAGYCSPFAARTIGLSESGAGRYDTGIGGTMETIDIEVDALRDWLESGRPVTVLDIRPADQREEWRIPGSLHVDAQAAMRPSAPATVGGVPVPSGQPVVAVCAQGKSSILAVRAMREQGIEALSLKGGMQAWSLAWNVADVDLPGSRPRIIQLPRT